MTTGTGEAMTAAEEVALRRTLAAELLRCAKALQRVRNTAQLMDAILPVIQEQLGYLSVWLYLFDPANPAEWKLISISGGQEVPVTQLMPTLVMDGDAMLAEIRLSGTPVTVLDARTDPRTDKAIVELLGNRSIVNVRLQVEDRFLGSLGTGSFGDEPIYLPDAVRLEWLQLLASYVAPVVERIFLAAHAARLEEEQRRLTEQLRQVQKLEVVGTLAGGIAHDFNNLLGAIRANTLAATLAIPNDAEAHDDLRGVLHAVDLAASLTHQLVDLSRCSAAAITSVAIADVIHDVTTFAARALPKGVALRSSVAERLPTFTADAGRLYHALMNLILNARDAVPEHGGVITVTASQDGGFLVLSVTDNGCGMPPALVERVRDPFFTTKRQGTGLGLAMVQRCAEDHRGDMAIESWPGRGTNVRLTLPIDPAPALVANGGD